MTINQEITASISAGILALIGIEKSDTHESVRELAENILSYRIFPDSEGKMNVDLRDSGGQLLLVPQFTLAADTQKGRRPGFSTAATPTQAKDLFAEMVTVASREQLVVTQGTFGADMKVALVNDGPVTFWLQTRRQG